MAQSYPERSVRLVVGSATGGGGDLTARLVAKGMSEYWGQAVVVENMPGASQSIAVAKVATSPTDGYTLGWITSAVLGTALYADLSHNVERDLVPVVLVATGPAVLVVNSELPVHNVKELIELARSEPGKLNYGSGGIGTTSHLIGELFNQMSNIQTVHVPYPSTAKSAIAIASGEVQIGYPSFVATMPLIQANKLRALAVSGTKRWSVMPSLPTIGETLPGFNMGDWYGLFAPAGISKERLAELTKVAVMVASDPELTKSLEEHGLQPTILVSDEFAAKIHNDFAVYTELATKLGLKPN
ncbi:MAG: Bug family tripartite tricarboxylate transporter substrate binding protein [Dongiaceae bacterium]